MTTLLDDNRYPTKKYTNKAFAAVIITIVLLTVLYWASQLMIESDFPIHIYAKIAQVISISAIVIIPFGVFYTIKAITNKEPTNFKKVVAIIGNGFFFLMLLLLIWEAFHFDIGLQ